MSALLAGALVVVLAFAVALGVTARLLRPGSRWSVLDLPNDRSLHEQPTPRGGGLGIMSGLVAAIALQAWLLEVPTTLAAALGATAVVGIVSFVDDRGHVPAAARLLVQTVAAAIALRMGELVPSTLALPGVTLSLGVVAGAALALLYLVWMTNLYNFMDGMDGFAGGMTVAGFATLGALGLAAGQVPFAVVALAVAAAAAGFLVFNVPPARIFMGDVGSSALGILAGVMTLWAARDGIAPLWVGVLVFSPFVVDATVTLIARALAGERVWEAHRTHCYQRLVRAGWGHRRTVRVEWMLMAACAVSAVLATRLSATGQAVLLVAWAIAYTGAVFAVRRLAR
ncbi:MAG: glycosyltransferase family 4 protein [Ectothiorhodospiraceae bacterium]|nr:glycosyltransferase family 4 protein [Ectothiorhodospiraceae bacterium]